MQQVACHHLGRSLTAVVEQDALQRRRNVKKCDLYRQQDSHPYKEQLRKYIEQYQCDPMHMQYEKVQALSNHYCLVMGYHHRHHHHHRNLRHICGSTRPCVCTTSCL